MRSCSLILIAVFLLLNLTGCGGGPAAKAEFSFLPGNPAVGQEITFDGSSSSGGRITSYLWSFGDGSSSSGVTAKHTYTKSGNYTVTLRVRNDKNKTASKSKSVTVTGEQKADFDFSPSSPQPKQSVQFTDKSSGCEITAYEWDFGDGGTSTDQNPTHNYNQAGTFDVKLIVTCKDGKKLERTKQITVGSGQNQPPVACIAPIGAVRINQAVPFDGSCSSDPDGTITNYTWDFGDGGTATGAKVSHVFRSTGNFRITLTVTDDKGARGSIQTELFPTSGNCTPGTSFRTPAQNPLGLAWDGSSFWLGSFTQDSETIYKLDRNGNVQATWNLENLDIGAFPTALAWAENIRVLWVVDGTELRAYRVNPSSPVSPSYIPVTPLVPSGLPTGAAWDGNYLWVVDGASKRLYKINPNDGSEVASYAVPGTTNGGFPEGLAFGAGSLWHVDGLDGFFRIDPNTGQAVAVCALPRQIARPRSLTWDGNSLWVVNDQDKKVYQIRLQ